MIRSLDQFTWLHTTQLKFICVQKRVYYVWFHNLNDDVSSMIAWQIWYIYIQIPGLYHLYMLFVIFSHKQLNCVCWLCNCFWKSVASVFKTFVWILLIDCDVISMEYVMYLYHIVACDEQCSKLYNTTKSESQSWYCHKFLEYSCF